MRKQATKFLTYSRKAAARNPASAGKKDASVLRWLFAQDPLGWLSGTSKCEQQILDLQSNSGWNVTLDLGG